MTKTNYFLCTINFKETPMKLDCSKKFNSFNDAYKYLDNNLGQPIDRNNRYMTSVVPLCGYFPDFINFARAQNIALNNMIKKN